MNVGLSRVQAGSGIGRRENPFFQENDDRAGVWLRGDRDIRRRLRLGADGGWQHVSFGGTSNRFLQTGGDVTLDTRIDPLLARNAVYARAGLNHLTFTNAQDANRTDVDLRGYFGLIGQSVLVIRGQRQDSNHPLPPISVRCSAAPTTCAASGPGALSVIRWWVHPPTCESRSRRRSVSAKWASARFSTRRRSTTKGTSCATRSSNAAWAAASGFQRRSSDWTFMWRMASVDRLGRSSRRRRCSELRTRAGDVGNVRNLRMFLGSSCHDRLST